MQNVSLVRVLGEGAGLDPRAAYRELVDRAADACARRVAIDPACAPSILVSTQSFGGVVHVSVTDSGEAFEADAFRALYQVIQGGRIGAVKRALAANDPDDVVGTFGTALLAAFQIADRIVITTRAHDAAADEAVKFTCDSRTYVLDPATSPRAGTIVQLRVRSDRARLATIETIREALATHARSIAFPVRIGSDPRALNQR